MSDTTEQVPAAGNGLLDRRWFLKSGSALAGVTLLTAKAGAAREPWTSMPGSGMSESNNHERLDLPTLLVGGFGGRGGRLVEAAPETPNANFLLSLGQHFGAEIESFGMSTGTVAI